MSGQHSGPAHEGNSRTMGTHADEKSDGCIVPVKPRTMPSDIGGGDGGGKAAGRGEGELQRMPRTQRRNRHVTERAHGSELYGYPMPEGRSRSTRDRSRVRESRMPGSARGARSNPRPYRDPRVRCQFALQQTLAL